MTRIDSRPSNANESLRADIARQQTQGASPGVKDAKKTGVVEGLTSVGLPHVASPVGADTSLSLAGANGEPNPFVSLLQAGALIPPRELAASLALAKDPSPNEEALLNLGALEAKVADLGEGKCEAALGRLGNVRKGLMLVLSDAANAHLKASGGGSRETMQGVASAIHEDVKLELKTFAATQAALLKSNAQFPLGMDVNAFVQAVLRESYMLQCEMMRDYAEKVKYYNELKKQIRAQKAEAMKLRSSLEEGDGTTPPSMIPEEFFIYFDAEKGEMVQYDASVPSSAADEIIAGAETGSDAGSTSGGATTAAGNTSALRGTWTPGLSSYFGDPVSLDSSTLHTIATSINASYGKGLKWTDNCLDSIYRHKNPDRVGNEADSQELRDLMSREMPFADWGSFNTVLRCLLEKTMAGRDDKANSTIRAIVDSASFEMLALFKDKLGGTPYWSKLREVCPEMQLKLDSYQAAKGGLPASLRDSQDPAVQRAVSAYCQLVVDSRNGVPPELIASRKTYLESCVGGLSATGAQAFFAGVEPTCSTENFNVMFEALDGANVFRDASPTAWSFLADNTGTSGQFFAAWTEQTSKPSASPSVVSLLTGQKPNVALKVATPSMALGTPVMAPARIMGQAGTSSAGFTNETEASTDASPPDEAETDETTKLVAFNADVMDNFIKALEENLNSVGDDAQLANNDLQNALQQQQQVLQMMSNISKMLHDTAMSIIRKIGG